MWECVLVTSPLRSVVCKKRLSLMHADRSLFFVFFFAWATLHAGRHIEACNDFFSVWQPLGAFDILTFQICDFMKIFKETFSTNFLSLTLETDKMCDSTTHWRTTPKRIELEVPFSN